jgi:hypothetical protein
MKFYRHSEASHRYEDRGPTLQKILKSNTDYYVTYMYSGNRVKWRGIGEKGVFSHIQVSKSLKNKSYEILKVLKSFT